VHCDCKELWTFAASARPFRAASVSEFHRPFGGDVVDGRITLPKNTILDGSYRSEDFIGSGGFAVTYVAEDINLGNKFALKEYYQFDFGDRDSTMSVRLKSERDKKTFEWGRASLLRKARINVTSMRLMAKYAVPHMIGKRKGPIVNVASVAGPRGGHPNLLYATSKGAIMQMTRAMAANHGPDGVRVNCVAPGIHANGLRPRNVGGASREAAQALAAAGGGDRLGCRQGRGQSRERTGALADRRGAPRGCRRDRGFPAAAGIREVGLEPVCRGPSARSTSETNAQNASLTGFDNPVPHRFCRATAGRSLVQSDINGRLALSCSAFAVIEGLQSDHQR